MLNKYALFDSHLHIIDKRFPLITNNGFKPDPFSHTDYLTIMHNYQLCGGAIVSGSFQGFDQSYLIEALRLLGPAYVGVTQLPATVSDEEIISLNQLGVRAIRFNLKRGGSENIRHLSDLASRIYEVARWHIELYIDSTALPDLYQTLLKLPAVSIDHLGLSQSHFKTLLQLVEKGIKVKASGFGRVDIPIINALKDLYAANPHALMFGTDHPSTRAAQKYRDSDFLLVLEALQDEGAQQVFSQNAINFYRPKALSL